MTSAHPRPNHGKIRDNQDGSAAHRGVFGVTPLQARLIRALTTERMRKCLHRAGIVLRLDLGHCLTANDMSNDLEFLPIMIHSTYPIDSEPVHIRSGVFESPGSQLQPRRGTSNMRTNRGGTGRKIFTTPEM